MAKDKLTDYDSTASNNTDVGGISVAEGMLPSGVNNAMRELMSHQADAFGAGTPLYVDQTNNRLGVGNAAPTVPLDVTGAAAISGDLTVDTDTLYVDSTNNRVGVGTASPSSGLTIASQDIRTTFSGADDVNSLILEGSNGSSEKYTFELQADGANTATKFLIGSAGGAATERLRIDSSGDILAKTIDARIGSDVGSVEYGTSTANSVRFYTSNAERMRINSSGSLIINSTSTDYSEKLKVEAAGAAYTFHSVQNSTNSQGHIVFSNANGAVGTIFTNGTSTSYNTSSDYRLKENVVADWDATTRLKQLNPVRFNFIADAATTVDGFLAHEVQDIVPEAISGTKDAMRDEQYEVTSAVFDDDGNVVTPAVMGTRSVPDYQGIDQSKLVPLLVKTIQELEARIAALETA